MTHGDPLFHGEIVDDAQIDDAEVVDAREASPETLLAPALARAAGGVWWRATKWGVTTTARTGARLARVAAAATGADSAGHVVDDLVEELRGYARDLLGITELDDRVAHLMPDTSRQAQLPQREALRVRGARLLRASAEVDGDDGVHPAYARILTELAGDEARILRLLASDGARAAVDVRAAGLIGVGSQLVAGGFSMIGPEAGCRHKDRVQAYLNNLERLGLIWFSHEPIDDPVAYQVLEAQPEVMDAMRRPARARTVQRSIQLTPFGEDFCAICLPASAREAEVLAGEEPAGDQDP
jgi:hypothetical protein